MLEMTLDRRLTGGLRLLAHKAQSTTVPILRGAIPPQLILALHQHGGHSATPIVGVGQRVAKGEMIAAPGEAPSAAVHASSSGRVTSIEQRQIPAGNRLRSSLCIVIETDGEDRPFAPETDNVRWPQDRKEQLRRVLEGGLAGLGGAVFPTAAKLATATRCRTLIVNGAECEPYISCDDMLMRECPAEIVAGARLMCDLLESPLCIIAIERDKSLAIEAIAGAARAAGDPRLKLAEVPTIYPAGGERQLIELLTGEEVPSGSFPTAIGHVCQNVGTAFALHRLAASGEPLTARVVSVTGGGVMHPRNIEARLGTPVSFLIDLCGGYGPEIARLIHGGSMMGYALPNDDVPVTKATSCIIAATSDEVRQDFEEWPCIRCGECSSACPARLMPQDLVAAATAGDFAELDALGLDDCIECGCCDVVCPSRIVLTERFRRAKHEVAKHQRQLELSAEAEERYRRRERRIEASERGAREAQDALRAEVHADGEARRKAIEAAVARARRRRGSEES